MHNINHCITDSLLAFAHFPTKYLISCYEERELRMPIQYTQVNLKVKDSHFY